MKSAAVVLVTIAVMGSGARAESKESSPDPAAVAAGEANLESQAKRRGLTFGVSFGPSVTIGGGTGTGGAASFKLGQVATPRTVIAFELNGSAQRRKVAMGDIATNTISSFTVGAQYWVGPSLWIRGLGGIGFHHCDRCDSDLSDRDRVGLAGSAGLGIDLARARGVVLGLEGYGVSQLNRDGLLTTLVFALSLSVE